MSKTFFLGILTYFKNERSSIYEWILHYKKWGVDHIWMIDNGSTDDYNIEEFINEGFVTVYKESTLDQQNAYNKYVPRIKKEVKWLGVLDMDEFLYSKDNDDLKHVVSNINQNNKIISIQMTIFLPATFESKESIIEMNILNKFNDSNTCPKCLFNLDLLNKVSIHGFEVKKKLHLTADKTLLCINHYRYGSFEYLYGIKEGRGGGVHKNKYRNGLPIKQINSLNDKDLPNNTYLRDKSHDIIELCKKTNYKPKIELYPESSWMFLKNNQTDIYNEFNNYNKILNIEQIYEINLHLNQIQQKLFKN
jgi:hypothetical protein